MHYYKRHLGDYARDTGHLSALEHGVYTLLLDWYYVNERPIPHDKATRIARGNPTETQTVLDEFFVRGPEGWMHRYADREIAKYHAKAAANREAGKLGGRPKKSMKSMPKTQTVSKRKPNGNPEETLTTNHKPLTINQEEDQKKKPAARSAPPPSKPEGVTDETWDGWLELRRKKRAPVTAKVLSEAEAEAARAGMTLDRFLSVWVYRGSQGLQADWLKPHERAGPAGKPSASADFRHTTYTGTPYDEIPPDLR